MAPTAPSSPTSAPTDPSTLPQYKGRPVPWVTRWSKETHPDRYKYGIQATGPKTFKVCYSDGKENRDGAGVLWQREGINRGGEPEWAAVSTYRQRRAMNRRLCQVCGSKITDQPIQWIMPIDGMEQVDDDTTITMQPPTCSACIPVALDLCPNLKRRGYKILKVADYSVWGVFGHIVAMTEGGPRKFQSAVAYDTSEYGPHFSLEHVMAQQMVVRLDKFVVVEDVAGTHPKPTHPYLPEMLAKMAEEFGVTAETVMNDLAEELKREQQTPPE